jgi:hypothetical protein
MTDLEREKWKKRIEWIFQTEDAYIIAQKIQILFEEVKLERAENEQARKILKENWEKMKRKR